MCSATRAFANEVSPFKMFGLAARQHAFRAAEGPVLRPVGDSLPLSAQIARRKAW
jgi:hypothetical protein